VIRVAMSFYVKGREHNEWTEMPQVPAVGDSLFYSPDGLPEYARIWNVLHVSWACDSDLWHAEIGLR
jgi:hypothetical protein